MLRKLKEGIYILAPYQGDTLLERHHISHTLPLFYYVKVRF